MINIAELLKNAPKDLKLYSPLCGHCKLSCILYDDGIRVIAHDVPFRFDKYGKFCSADDAECLLFPSKGRTWEGWELPVEPKFKAGDWITNDTFTHCIVSIVDGFYYFYGGGYLDFGKIDGYYRLWSIQDAKDGDVLAADECYVIFKEIDGLNIKCYCTYHYMGFNPSFHIDTLQNKTAFHPATKEQRDLLFAKIKEAGYEWDEKEKELRKIKPHYDISNFKPFDKVLVRDRNYEPWRIAFYGFYNEEAHYSHFVGTRWSKQCIPFNDETKHLLGTTDMPSEEYINW